MGSLSSRLRIAFFPAEIYRVHYRVGGVHRPSSCKASEMTEINVSLTINAGWTR